MYAIALEHRRTRKRPWITYDKANMQLIRGVNIYRLVFDSDLACTVSIRMDQRAFHHLCELLTISSKLVDTRNIIIAEMITYFLYTI